MKFYLDTDQSSHWFIIPYWRRKDWEAWNELDEDDEAGWDPPEWAVPVNGHPSLVTFENPQVGGYVR